MSLQTVTNPLYVTPAAAAALSLTPSGVAWTSSAWVQVTAAADADWIIAGLSIPVAGTAQPFEIDLGTGAAGSEAVITTFRGDVGSTTNIGPNYLRCPIPLDKIATGVRVAVRIRHNSTDVTPWTVAVVYYKKPIAGTMLTTAKPQKCAPAAANSTAVNVSGSAWTSGTWTQIIASSAAALVLVGVVVQTGAVAAEWELDIGTGAAAAEVVITTLRFGATAGPTDGPSFVPFANPLDNIATATRVAARTRHSGTTATTAAVALVYIEKPL